MRIPLSVLFLVAAPLWAWAHDGEQHARPAALRDVGFEQRLGEEVPLDLAFRDEAGRPVRLGDYFGTRPVIVVPAYYSCPNLCPMVLDGLLKSLRVLSFDLGREFAVVTVSIDPRDTPAAAAARKGSTIRRYGRAGAGEGWHFLTGEPGAIERLTRAIGFQYAYDAEHDQYAHASGVVVATPRGKIARYFYGIEFSPRDLRLGLVEASAGEIGSPVDQVLLFCYRYDPTTGKYSVIIMNVLRLAGMATVLGLGTFMVAMFRMDRRNEGAGKREAEERNHE